MSRSRGTVVDASKPPCEPVLQKSGAATRHQEVEDRDHGLEKNVYSAVIATSIGASQDPSSFFLGLVMHGLNMFLQIGMVSLLYIYSIEKREDPFEIELFNRTALLREALRSDPPERLNATMPEDVRTLNMCTDLHVITLGIYIGLFLWWTRMLPELLRAVSSVRQVLAIRGGSTRIDPAIRRKERRRIVTHMSVCLKLGLLVTVCVPRLLIGACLTLVGSKALLYPTTVGWVFSKSFGLAFICGMDEVVEKALSTKAMGARVDETFLRCAVHPKRARLVTAWNSYLSTFGKIMTILLCLLLVSSIFPESAAFRQACHDYKLQFLAEDCPNCGYHLFNTTLLA